MKKLVLLTFIIATPLAASWQERITAAKSTLSEAGALAYKAFQELSQPFPPQPQPPQPTSLLQKKFVFPALALGAFAGLGFLAAKYGAPYLNQNQLPFSTSSIKEGLSRWFNTPNLFDWSAYRFWAPKQPAPPRPATPDALRKAAQAIDEPLDEILAYLPAFDSSEFDELVEAQLSPLTRKARGENAQAFKKQLPRAVSSRFEKIEKEEKEWAETLSGSVRGLADARKKLIHTFSRQLRNKELGESIRIARDLTTVSEEVKGTVKNKLEPIQLFQVLMHDAYYATEPFILEPGEKALLDKGTYRGRKLSVYFLKMLPIIHTIIELEKLYETESDNLDRLDQYLEKNEDAFMDEFYKIPSENNLVWRWKSAMQAVSQNPDEANEEAAVQVTAELNGNHNASKQLEKELDTFLNSKKVEFAEANGINPQLATIDDTLNKLSTRWAQLVTPIIWPRMVQPQKK